MHHASNQLRYLYGLNGLGDVGIPGPALNTGVRMPSRNVMSLPGPDASSIGVRDLVRSMFTASNSPDPTNPNQEQDDTAATCGCAISSAASLFTLPPELVRDMNIMCANNPPAFIAALQQQAMDAGVALDIANCGNGNGTPWYKQPKNLAIGAAVLGGGALLWMVFR